MIFGRSSFDRASLCSYLGRFCAVLCSQFGGSPRKGKTTSHWWPFVCAHHFVLDFLRVLILCGLELSARHTWLVISPSFQRFALRLRSVPNAPWFDHTFSTSGAAYLFPEHVRHHVACLVRDKCGPLPMHASALFRKRHPAILHRDTYMKQ